MVKIYLEIPPCGKIVIFIDEFVILGTFMKYGKVVARIEEFRKYFSRPLFTIIFRPKNVFLDTDSILRVKTDLRITQVHIKCLWTFLEYFN